MTDQDASDQFAAELTRRFEELTQWAISHWPYRNFPLMESDFAESRREISVILGRKLDAGKQGEPPCKGPDDSSQYIDMNPMPWP